MSLRRSPPANTSSGRYARRAGIFFLMAALLSAPSVHASLSDGSNSGSGSVYSAWDPQDECSAPISRAGCVIGVTCDACLKRPGCAIESTTGKCVSLQRINASVGIEYYESGKESYCEASDDACSACSANSTSSGAVCRGADGCICIRQCEANPIEVIECNAIDNSKLLLYGVIALSIMAPIVLVSRVQKKLSRSISTSMSRHIARERREARRASNPLTLKLDGWRHHMEHEPKQDQPTKIELKRCSRLLSDASTMEEGRKTEDWDALSPSGSHVSIDVVDDQGPRNVSDGNGDEYVSISTPRGTDSAPSHSV